MWLQVVISLLIGLGVGLVLGDDVGVNLDDNTLDTVSSYLKIPANIFLSVILMIIVPLIFASIVVAITNLGTKEKMKTLGLGIGVYFVITTTIAILIAITLASVIAPGSILDLTALQETHDLSEDDLKVTEGFSVDDIPEIASNVIPRNPIVSYLEGQMLSILIMAMIVGLAMAALPKESVKPLLDLLESIQKNYTVHPTYGNEDCTVCSIWFDCRYGCQSWSRNHGRVRSVHGNCNSWTRSNVVGIHNDHKVCSKKTNLIYILKVP